MFKFLFGRRSKNTASTKNKNVNPRHKSSVRGQRRQRIKRQKLANRFRKEG